MTELRPSPLAVAVVLLDEGSTTSHLRGLPEMETALNNKDNNHQSLKNDQNDANSGRDETWSKMLNPKL